MIIDYFSQESLLRETICHLKCREKSENLRNCSNSKLFYESYDDFIENYLFLHCSNQTEQGYLNNFKKSN